MFGSIRARVSVRLSVGALLLNHLTFDLDFCNLGGGHVC